jgi:hypothetical protein
MGDPPTKVPLFAVLPSDAARDRLTFLSQLAERAGGKYGLTIVLNEYHGQVLMNVHNEGDPVMVDHTQITADRGSVVGYKARLENVRIAINSSLREHDDASTALRQAVTDFATKLEQAEHSHKEDVEHLSGLLELMTRQIEVASKPRRKDLLEVSAEGIKKAAAAVGDIVPGLIAAAEQIALAVARWLP